MADERLPPKKGPGMATASKPRVRENSAEEKLLEAFGEMFDSAAGKMSHEELIKTAKESKKALDRAIGNRPQRRGTA